MRLSRRSQFESKDAAQHSYFAKLCGCQYTLALLPSRIRIVGGGGNFVEKS